MEYKEEIKRSFIEFEDSFGIEKATVLENGNVQLIVGTEMVDEPFPVFLTPEEMFVISAKIKELGKNWKPPKVTKKPVKITKVEQS